MDKSTRAGRQELLDESLTYEGAQLDRDVVSPSQIRTVMRHFRDVLFTELFPGRTDGIVPKTLIFAKDYNHAENIVRIAREEFDKGKDFCQKITYRADRKPGCEQAWTDKVWFYDYRTNIHHTLKQNPLARADLDEFVTLFNPTNRFERTPTWSEESPDGRWRAYTYDEIMARDKVNLDIFWLRDESLEDTDNLPDPDIIAAEIVEDLESALGQFRLIAEDLGSEAPEI